MYNLVSFIARSKLRLSLLRTMNSPKTPTQLAKELNTHRSAISRDLLKLEKRGLVKCLSPDEKVFRLYLITDEGAKILKVAEELQDN